MGLIDAFLIEMLPLHRGSSPATGCRAGSAPNHPAEETAVLLLSETFTNACVHTRSRVAGGRVDVAIELSPALLHIEVTDEGGPSTPLAPATPADDSENGRGLWLLDLLSKEWGSHHLPDGRHLIHYTVHF